MLIKHFVIAAFMSILNSTGAYSQQCGNCQQTPSVALFDLEVQIPQPDLKDKKSSAWLEWQQLNLMSKHVHAILYKINKNCILFAQLSGAKIADESFAIKDGTDVSSLNGGGDKPEPDQPDTNLPPSDDVSKLGNYITTGYVKKSGDAYVLHLEIQTACSRKTVAVADVSFKLSAQSATTASVANQAVAQLSPLIEKIKQFELSQRDANSNGALEGNLKDEITIKPGKRNLAVGEQTQLEIALTDCDGTPLANREIVFTQASLNGIPISAGTTGGAVIPSKVTTDAAGKAKAIFKMGMGNPAIIDAHSVYQKPYGCEDVKLGSTTINTIRTNNVPIRVEVDYFQNEIHWLKRATLPGVKIRGGTETEKYEVEHTTILYHYTDEASIKKGVLIDAAKEDSAEGRTLYIVERGYYDFTKKVEDAFIMGVVDDKPVVADTEVGSQSKIDGIASLQHPSEIMFFLGNANEPPSFMWNVQYPANGENIAGAGATIVKGEDGVQWIVNKITDKGSPYKTEYLLTLKLDAAEEFKKGNRAMKELFGTDLNGLTGKIDPTNPQSNMAGASGSQLVTVRILSPYPEK